MLNENMLNEDIDKIFIQQLKRVIIDLNWIYNGNKKLIFFWNFILSILALHLSFDVLKYIKTQEQSQNPK